ncbi:DUF6624 domain-containing protein [Granulicella paludicola]|uniref:DUF6624 domain-containing protein n=1 Tax=Granulicella paludicola TaxID=474951 RepID=UPI0021E0E6F2|nr:DUF6624 domain-containing protein [Granulicella paludicola]
MSISRYTASLVLLTCIASGPAFAVLAQSPSTAQASTDWKTAIAQRREALIARNGPGTDPQLRDELLKMRDEDQKARGIDPAAKSKGHVEIASNLADIDAALTKELQLIVKGRGWPTISMVGIDASNAAMLIMTHTRDHAWQVSLLPMLTNLADEKKIDGSALALVVDKELVFEGKLQRYGTQFKQLEDGSIAMYSVEDPGGLDRERAEVMLPPIDVYKGMMANMYHLKVSNKLVMATPQKQ